MSSLKEALLSGSQLYNEGKPNSAPSQQQTPGPSLGPPSNLGPSPGIGHSPGLGQSPGMGPSPGPVGGVNYPGNSSPFLGMSDVRERVSPMPPNVGSLSTGPTATQTPRMSSPAGLMGVATTEGGGDSPLLSQPTPPTEPHTEKNSFDGGNSATNLPPAVNRQPSPFEVDSILGLKGSDASNGKNISPVNNEHIGSPASSIGGGGSPRSRKVYNSLNDILCTVNLCFNAVETTMSMYYALCILKAIIFSSIICNKLICSTAIIYSSIQ